MSSGCYILYSETVGKHYIGACREDLNRRIMRHNQGYYGNRKFTASASDWELVLFLESLDYSHALRIEQKIKRMKSSRYIANLQKYPELREKVIQETKDQ
jgi:putative endonuclease